MQSPSKPVRALCVGRHHFLASHFARFFAALGVETSPAVGLEEGLVLSRELRPDVIIAEYELLATLPIGAWENDELLSGTALIAVSMTRRPAEAHLMDVNGIAGFLYLPLLDGADAIRIIEAAAASSRNRYVSASEAILPSISDIETSTFQREAP